jgi:hypothetical protein
LFNGQGWHKSCNGESFLLRGCRPFAKANYSENKCLVGEIGFTLEQEYYSNQYYGALKWLSAYDRQFIIDFADPTKAKDENGKKRLRKIRSQLLFLQKNRKLVADNSFISLFRSILYHIKAVIKVMLKVIWLPVAKLITQNLASKGHNE